MNTTTQKTEDTQVYLDMMRIHRKYQKTFNVDKMIQIYSINNKGELVPKNKINLKNYCIYDDSNSSRIDLKNLKSDITLFLTTKECSEKNTMQTNFITEDDFKYLRADV